MGVCKSGDLTPTKIKVKKYNIDIQKEEEVVCVNAAELIGKIFVSLFVETYSIYKDEERKKIELFASFNDIRQSYREQNAGVAPKDIENAFEAMLKKSQKSREKIEREKQYNTVYQAVEEANNKFSDDDIPF